LKEATHSYIPLERGSSDLSEERVRPAELAFYGSCAAPAAAAAEADAPLFYHQRPLRPD